MNRQLRYNSRLVFNTSIGVFLFILFFQPFEAKFENVNNLILFFAGFGGIVFILNSIILIAFPAILPKALKIGRWEVGPPFLLNALIVVLNSVAFPFYLRFVGGTPITFHIVIMIVLILLSTVTILRLFFIIKHQKQHIISLKNKLNISNSESFENKKIETNNSIETIEIFSENKSEKLKLNTNNILYIKAADNYIEVIYFKNDNTHKKLLRNTLKNIELQLSDYKNFIRCHRTFMVNLDHVEKLSKNYSGNYLKLSDIEEEIPVSRHYLLKVQETVNIL